MTQSTESQESPSDGSRPIIAFFDMDKTLLRVSSATLYLRHMLLTGEIPPSRWWHALRVVFAYVTKRMEFPDAMIRLYGLSSLSGNDRGTEIRLSRFERVLIDHIAPAAREQVLWHAQRGHEVAIISAQLEPFVRTVAQAIGIGDAFVATRTPQDTLSEPPGALQEPPFGRGKVAAASSYAFSRGVDLGDCFFYTDSHTDLPLLEVVGIPIAANPDRILTRIARERGWKVVRFF